MEGVSSAFKKVMESEEKNKKCYKYKPPDGGWGWVIVISYALQNMILLPVIINFGLMFRDVFTKLNMSTTDSSIIINVNSATGLLFGLFNGPLLKTFGFRKIGCLGALLTCFGNSMTSFATSLGEFLIYYGIISSIGVALVMASFSLALNTYFLERRGVATGLAMAATGLGPIFIPLLISKLMTVYGGRGTSLIMAGLTLHSFAGAMLLQPVKWHHHKVEEEKDINKVETGAKDMATIENAEDNKMSKHCTTTNEHLIKRRLSDTTPFRGVCEKSGSIHSLNIPLRVASKISLTNNVITDKNEKEVDDDKMNDKYKAYKVKENDNSETEAFLQIGDKKYHQMEKFNEESENKPNAGKTWQTRLVEMFDLDLLKEPVFRNIWIGMAIAYMAEMNFTLMTPFILGEMGYSTESTAKMMSIMGIADISTRFISPFISSRTNIPARYLYLLSLFILIIFRYCLTVVESHIASICVFIGLGLGRGLLSVYRALVVPNHVPLEKLPSASGLTTVLNGILLMSFGPLLGYIRDEIGSYDWFIYVLNILSLITIIMWLIEFAIRIYQQRRLQQQ